MSILTEPRFVPNAVETCRIRSIDIVHAADQSKEARSPRRLTRRRFAVACMLFMMFALAVEVLYVLVGSNLHAVVPGICYRSAQLSSDKLERVVRARGIRTVINLRGVNEGEDWYDEEAESVNRLGIKKVDVRLSGYAVPEDHDLRLLIDALNNVEYPILIHCHSGSDRSGLASALFLLLKTEADLNEARSQISVRFGHNPFGSATCPRTMLDSYADWLRTSGRSHTPEHLHQWAHQVYRYADYQTTVSRQGGA